MEHSTFASLARLIGREFSFYAVIARGTDGKSAPHKTVAEMAAAYIQDILSVEPAGPYFLIGECLSAPVAYETARQLRLQGKQIALVALLGASGRAPWVSRYFGSWLGARIRYYRNQWSWRRAGISAAWQSKHVRRAQKAYGIAVREYRPRPYDGKVVVFGNEEAYASDSTLGWDMPGAVEVHRIAGNHENYLRDHPEDVAVILRNYLDRYGREQAAAGH